MRGPAGSRAAASLSSMAFARIEAGGRLVEAEQHRVGAHRARDLEAALRAVGQVAGRIVGAVDADGSFPASSAPSRPRSSRRGRRDAARTRRAACSRTPPSACCAARPACSRTPSCRRTAGCSGTCARRAPAASPDSRACVRAGTARRCRACRLRVPRSVSVSISFQMRRRHARARCGLRSACRSR